MSFDIAEFSKNKLTVIKPKSNKQMKKIYTYLMAIPVVLTMAFATGCKDPEAPVPSPTPDPSKSPTISLSEDTDARTSNSATLIVTVTNADKFKYTYYAKDARPTDVKWTEKVVEKDGEHKVEINGLAIDVTKSTEYTFEAFACLKDSVSKPKTLDFKTLQAQIVDATDFRVASAKISFVGTCLPDHCDGFFWAIVKESEYSRENFINNCEFDPMEGRPLNGLVSGNGVCALEYALPQTDYVIAIQPIYVSEDGAGYKEKVGDVIEIKKSTPRYELNQQTVTPVEFALKGAAKPLSVELKAGRAADAEIGGCYFGIVKKSELNGKSAADYITESDWFNAHPAEAPHMSNYDIVCMFNDGDVEVSQSFSVEPNTEYVAFVIPYDKDRFVGAAQSLDVKTPSLSYDDKAKANVALTPTRSGAEVAIEFLEGCNRLYYVVEEKGAITLDSAVIKMVENAKQPFLTECWSVGESGTISGKKALTEYDVFLLPMSEQGNFGTATQETFTTVTDQIAVDPSITMEFVSIGAPTGGMWGMWDYECQLSLGASTTKYDYGQVAANLENLGDNPTAIQIASTLYTEWGFSGAGENKKDLTLTVSLSNGDSQPMDVYVVFIPKNKSGKLGTPVFKKISVPVAPQEAPAKGRR